MCSPFFVVRGKTSSTVSERWSLFREFSKQVLDHSQGTLGYLDRVLDDWGFGTVGLITKIKKEKNQWERIEEGVQTHQTCEKIVFVFLFFCLIVEGNLKFPVSGLSSK